MANDEGIRQVYGVAGIRGIGTAHVFPKTRVVKKAKKSLKEEQEPSEKSEREKPKDTLIDIEV
jgi:hypothetical protein